MVKISTVETMSLDGGNPALDLVNSGYALVPGVVIERLHNFNDLILLTKRHELLDQDTLAALSEKARHQPLEAENALKEVREARESLYTLLNALATSSTAAIDEGSLATYNRFLADSFAHRKISISGDRLAGKFEFEDGDLRQILSYYIWHAYELFTGVHQRFIKKCGRCSWLFLDETKNHKRRWCDMQVCGASDKAKRYYLKRKQMP